MDNPQQLISVPIDLDLYGVQTSEGVDSANLQEDDSIIVQKESESKSDNSFSRLKNKLHSSSNNSSSDGPQLTLVIMSMTELQTYWAKDKSGDFADGVREPEQGRKNWLEQQLDKQDGLHQAQKQQRSDAAKNFPALWAKGGGELAAGLGYIGGAT